MLKNVKELSITIVIAVILSIFFRVFIAEIVVIEGGSMLSTIDPGDRVIALKLTEPERNDIIIVNMGDKSIIKRLIAMEGDTVEIIDGELYLNDELLEEDYINEPMHLDTYEKVLLEEGELFVLGDNRNFSIDSIETGPVTMDDYEGKAKILFNLWSKFEFVK